MCTSSGSDGNKNIMKVSEHAFTKYEVLDSEITLPER